MYTHKSVRLRRLLLSLPWRHITNRVHIAAAATATASIFPVCTVHYMYRGYGTHYNVPILYTYGKTVENPTADQRENPFAAAYAKRHETITIIEVCRMRVHLQVTIQ